MSHQEETSNEVVRYMGEATSYYDHLARYVTTSTVRDVHMVYVVPFEFHQNTCVSRDYSPMHNVAYGNTF